MYIPTYVRTYMYTCVYICTCSCVTHLLRNFTGSSPFTPDVNGLTPLHYAAYYGHKMAVQMVS